MSNFIDLTGQKFGRLTAVKRGAPNKCGNIQWECVCECGNTTIVPGAKLKNGSIKSCGCLRKDVAQETGKSNLKHGGKRHNVPYEETRLYNIWSGMKQRCKNPKRPNYPDYGKKGIKVCEEWQNFANFQSWSLANGYTSELTIDRKDNDKDYEPSNCRWATPQEQNNNLSTNRRVTIDGVEHTVAEWSRITGVKKEAIYRRLNKGWAPYDAVHTPTTVRQIAQ